MSIIKSFSVGKGDMFYINHNSDNFTVIDCFYSSDEQKDDIFTEICDIASIEGASGICRFISTHPDDDHIGGIKDLFDKYEFLNFYCVKNDVTKEIETEDFKKYCSLRDDKKKSYYVSEGCQRKWMNLNDEKHGSAGINFIWPVLDNADFKDALGKAKDGVKDNNISPIFTYSVNEGVEAMWMGDMEGDFTEKIKDSVVWPKVDILFAPHHGRKSGRVPTDVLKKIDPKIIVIGEAPSKDIEYYSDYNTITQNIAGDIIFDCDNYIHVYVSNDNYSVDYLTNRYKADRDDGYYIGSIKTRNSK